MSGLQNSAKHPCWAGREAFRSGRGRPGREENLQEGSMPRVARAAGWAESSDPATVA